MIELIKENKFQELKDNIQNSESSFKIHKFLGDVLNKTDVVIDGGSFNAQKFQEEFSEGLKIYKALNLSEIPNEEFKAYSNILVELAFKTGSFIKVLADTALRNGGHLSDIPDKYKVDPNLRDQFQEFIDLLKEKADFNSVANIASAKFLITTSIGNLLKKEEIGQDMLQFAESYANVGQSEKAIQIYKAILNDFESESVKKSSGLFPEISQIDTRNETEKIIFEKAKFQYEKLSGHKLPEVKRVHVDNNEQAKKLVEEVHKKEKEIENKQVIKTIGFFGKLKRLWKNN